MKTVASFPTLEDAYLARSLLQSSGITAEIPDELLGQGGFLDNTHGGVRLTVPDQQAEQAREILDAAKKG